MTTKFLHIQQGNAGRFGSITICGIAVNPMGVAKPGKPATCPKCWAALRKRAQSAASMLDVA